MTSGVPRSEAGIESQARELVEDLARRSGLSAADLMRRLLVAEGPEDVTSQDFFNEAEKSPYVETARPGPNALPRIEALGHPVDELHRVTSALDRLTDRIELAESRSTVAIGGIERSVHQAIARLDDVEREQVAVAARFEGAVHELTSEQNRFGERVRRVEQEAVGPRSAEAVRTLEGSLGKVAGHLYEGESRTQAAIGALRQRIDQIEADRPADPASVMEEVVARITQRLEAAEGQTYGAIRDLQGAFATLDERMRGIEGQVGVGVDQKLSEMAAALASQVEAAREELVERIRSVGDPTARDDRLELAMSEVTSHVDAAERKSAEALGKMGRDILTVAEALGSKVTAVESRHADAVEQLGGAIARIANGVEDRLNRSDTAQAQALEKLGNEIGRVTERLSDRVANAERRAAQAIDDVGEQVARVTERLNAKTDRASSEIADRIRQSEERTARLLDEARERIDLRLADSQRLNDTARRHLDPGFGPQDAAFPGEPLGNSPFANPDFSPFANDPFAAFEAAPTTPAFGEPDFAPEPARGSWTPQPQQDAIAEAAAPEPVLYAPHRDELAAELPVEPSQSNGAAEFDNDLDLVAEVQSSAVTETQADPYPQADLDAAPALVTPDFSQVDFDAADAQAVQASKDEAQQTPDFNAAVRDSTDAFLAERHAATPSLYQAEAQSRSTNDDAPVAPQPLSTREIIERARASARANSPPPARPQRPAAPVESLPSSAGIFPMSEGHRRPRRTGSTLQTALLVSGLAAGFTAGVVGLNWMVAGSTGVGPDNLAQQLNAWRQGSSTQTAEATNAPAPDVTPRVAVALSPTPLAPNPAPAASIAAPTTPVTPLVPTTSTAGMDLYAQALAGIRTGDRNAVAALRRAATMGYAPAQFYLATLYNEGRAGVPRDLAQARIWTERAARGGDRWAMHNLALNYYEGSGGQPNPTVAAQWFRRAADLGLVDSQYNMGRLYETGVGVTQNPAEAYKWYLIAARSGDADSRASASRVRAGLSLQARASAERSATAYRPTAVAPLAAPPPTVTGSLDPAQITTAQRALARLRFLQGPADGVSTPALAAALSAFQRDRALPVTGVLDPATLARLQADAP